MKLAPSILSADRKMLQKEVSQIEPYSDIIHVDIMDGKFVPPVTFSPSEIKKVKSGLPKDIHLMVKHPMRDGYIEKFVDSGGKIVSIHIECDDNIDECINLIKKLGAKASIAVKPDTPLEAVFPYLNGLDMVLIMSVYPGYSGQKFIPEVLKKIRKLRKMKPRLDIEIDGGINPKTIKKAVDAGANVIVAASAIFNNQDRVKAIKELREAIC
ncbi:ribulose-phosphate 3-epimerase [Candidatus Woesearchaeota archaeon]|nr:ribulose-phosphate 3-epimerase [Candidatus Woesearchaeota archaeon]